MFRWSWFAFHWFICSIKLEQPLLSFKVFSDFNVCKLLCYLLGVIINPSYVFIWCEILLNVIWFDVCVNQFFQCVNGTIIQLYIPSVESPRDAKYTYLVQKYVKYSNIVKSRYGYHHNDSNPWNIKNGTFVPLILDISSEAYFKYSCVYENWFRTIQWNAVML